MKYVDEFRDGALAKTIAARIAAAVDPARTYHFMEFCGGHTHAIARYGVSGLLPANVRMIHGPGCPVCVLPIGRIDMAIELALQHRAIVCTYGDTMRVPASGQLSLVRAKARGGDIRMVYSAADALAIARQNPQREVVFFAIGFETTTPPTALAVRQAEQEALGNFSDPELAPVLVKALDTDNKYLLISVIEALGRIGAGQAEEPLLKLLNHAEAEVRRAVALALGALNT